MFNQSPSQGHQSVPVASSVMSLTAVIYQRKGVWGHCTQGIFCAVLFTLAQNASHNKVLSICNKDLQKFCRICFMKE